MTFFSFLNSPPVSVIGFVSETWLDFLNRFVMKEQKSTCNGGSNGIWTFISRTFLLVLAAAADIVSSNRDQILTNRRVDFFKTVFCPHTRGSNRTRFSGQRALHEQGLTTLILRPTNWKYDENGQNGTYAIKKSYLIHLWDIQSLLIVWSIFYNKILLKFKFPKTINSQH